MSTIQNIIQEHSFLIINLLFIFLLLAVLIIIRQERSSNVDSNSSSGGAIPRKKFIDEFKRREQAEEELDDYREKYESICSINRELESENQKLKLENNELRKLYDRRTVSTDFEKKDVKAPLTIQNTENRTSTNSSETLNIMYASFPRSAGSTIYFSDLSGKLNDDSYFELKVSDDAGKASFRPLDFMKIRNYDPAMAAILTDGVKPNVASTVVGVEPGEVQLEGNDWIIKRLAKVKLA